MFSYNIEVEILPQKNKKTIGYLSKDIGITKRDICSCVECNSYDKKDIMFLDSDNKFRCISHSRQPHDLCRIINIKPIFTDSEIFVGGVIR